jgi:hypothetical protein
MTGIIAKAIPDIRPPPKPWNARPIMNIAMFNAVAHAELPAINNTTPNR